MSSRTVFSLRMARCPACHARLPVQGRETVVVCEYCDARVEIVRRAPQPGSPRPGPPRHVARSHVSGLAVALLAIVVLVGVAATVALVTTSQPNVLAVFEPATASPPSSPTPVAAPQAGTTEPVAPSTEPADPIVQPPPTPAQIEPEAPAQDRPSSKPSGSKPKPPSGPVLTASAAQSVLEPKVLACMRTTKTHSLLAYMGNETVGPVKLLRDSRTRVDGLRAKLIGTPLGRCIDEAGASLRVRAFKSDYVRLHLRNEAVPDPLAGLPAKPDRTAIASAIEARAAGVHACAAKHGEEGAREVFYFDIDGPTGKVISVRGSYGSRGFRRCAEAIYRTIEFERVQEYQVKHTHHVQL